MPDMFTPGHNKRVLRDRRRELRRNQTDAETRIWHFLRARRFDGHKFHRQYGIGPYILDFYCCEAKLAIELDGGQHADQRQVAYDEERTAFLNSMNIQVLRFWNHDVLKDAETVLEVIRSFVDNIDHVR